MTWRGSYAPPAPKIRASSPSLLPLVLVVLGRYLYKDRMTWWQWAAAATALVGVVYEIIRVGGIG